MCYCRIICCPCFCLTVALPSLSKVGKYHKAWRRGSLKGWDTVWFSDFSPSSTQTGRCLNGQTLVHRDNTATRDGTYLMIAVQVHGVHTLALRMSPWLLECRKPVASTDHVWLRCYTCCGCSSSEGIINGRKFWSWARYEPANFNSLKCYIPRDVAAYDWLSMKIHFLGSIVLSVVRGLIESRIEMWYRGVTLPLNLFWGFLCKSFRARRHVRIGPKIAAAPDHVDGERISYDHMYFENCAWYFMVCNLRSCPGQ